MISWVVWYVLISFIGWLTFPLARRLLPNLGDRGYAFMRPLGLLIWGYSFWLLASLHILQNNAGGVSLALFLLAVGSVWAVKKTGWQELKSWLGQHKRMVITGELVFLLAFAGWALMRAASPDIAGTEKPMEMAFINSILRSPEFPPRDPWLSGYAISYYYFGYVMVAMLTRLSGTDPSIAFNLAVSLWFALTALAAYGLVYNLLAEWSKQQSAAKDTNATSSAGWALLGPLYILFVSNIEGFLEMLHARGIFWNGQAQTGFWSWLGIQEIDAPPTPPLTWIPNRPGGIWWWRASRVLSDYDMSGTWKEIIDEFPFFSYYLSDLHPHVLAMPFVLMAIALALNLYLGVREKIIHRAGFLSWLSSWLRGVDLRQLEGDDSAENAPELMKMAFRDTFVGSWLHRFDFWLAVLVLGALAFLNTWDFPIYVALFSATFILIQFEQGGWSWRRIGEFVELGLLLGFCGVILYLPFYIGFASQAGGILPSLVYSTRGVNFWVMFATLLVPIAAWLIWNWRHEHSPAGLRTGLWVGLSSTAAIWLLSFLMGYVAIRLPDIGNLLALIRWGGRAVENIGSSLINLGGLFYSVQGTSNGIGLIQEAFQRRIEAPGTWLTLLVVLVLVWGLLSRSRHKLEENDATDSMPSRENAFVLLLVLVGIGLTLLPEFIYLRDQFGWRMNTIFKFYFQTWIVWGIAAAYASAVLWQQIRSKVWINVFRLVLVIMLATGLTYPFWGIYERLSSLQFAELTLDGTNFIERSNSDEMAAMRWLRQAPYGVVAEAIGGQYSGFGRMATYSGLPTVLGWAGHEGQWGRGAKELGNRDSDIQLLYKTGNWKDAQQIITEYQIRYIVVGNMERSSYRVSEQKFKNGMKAVFQSASVTIYEAPDEASANAAGIP